MGVNKNRRETNSRVIMRDLLKRLENVMSVQTTSYDTKRMNSFIFKEVKDIPGCKIKKIDGNIYVTKGRADIYPCVVAHTDTVHDIEKEFYVKKHGDALYAINEKYERVGIGGDDKVGVFIALEALRTNSICKVAFFRDEEVGCHGSRVAEMNFFKDVSFVLQCDRQGYEDFVSSIFYTELYTQEFGDAIEPLLYKYGRFESDGGLTDVYQLAENGLDICVANMSCGYYDPHSDNEYIIISEVFRTLDFVNEVINTMGDTQWKIDRVSYDYSTKGKKGGYDYRKWNDLFSDDENVYDDTYAYDDSSTNNSRRKDGDTSYLVHGASCKNCDCVDVIHWDEFIDQYYCFGCTDYIHNDDVDFNLPSRKDSIIEYIDEVQKEIDGKEIND